MGETSDDKRRPSRYRGALRAYLQQIRDIQLLTQSGEVRLARESIRGSEHARNQLVEHNLRLVVKIALEYRNSAVSLDDLVAEGNLGLLEAVKRFDPERGVRFVSYAAWWVRKFMVTALQKASQQSTMPTSARGPRRGAVSGAGAPAPGSGRPARQRVLSFEDFMHNSGDRQIIDGVMTRDEPDPEDVMLEKQLEEALSSVLHRLPEIERRILEGHFGLGGGTPRTLQEIGQELGYTRERVRQIELRALERARRLLDR